MKKLAHKNRLISLLLAFIIIVSVGLSSQKFPHVISDVLAAPSADVFAPEKAQGLAIGNGRLFWFFDCQARIKSKPIKSGNIKVHYDSNDCLNSSFASANFAVDDEFIYWIVGDGFIVRLHQYATTESIETIGHLEFTYDPNLDYYITVDGENIYWNEADRIFQMPKTGGNREQIIQAPFHVKALKHLSDNKMAFLSGTQLFLAHKISPTNWKSYFIEENILSYTADTNRIYFAHEIRAGEDQFIIAIKSKALDKPEDAAVSHTFVDEIGSPKVYAMAVDDIYLYWHESRGDKGPIVRFKFLGETLEQIDSDVDTLTHDQLVSDGFYLYWTQPTSINPKIYRYAQNEIPIIYDFEADKIEVVQVIQNANNDVPLVQGKKTFVRLFSHNNVNFVNYISLSSPALLYGSDFQGNSLPGSPLRPIKLPNSPSPNQVQISNRLSDRTSIHEGFWFSLPLSWTKKSNIILRGVINPSHVIFENDYTNNEVSHTFNLQNKSPVCLVMVPVSTIFGTISHNDDSYDPIFARAELLLPTSDLRVYWRGGEPIKEYEFPFSSGPYEVSEADDDGGKILTRLLLRDFFSDDPDYCDNRNSRTHYVSMFPSPPWTDSVPELTPYPDGKALQKLSSAIFFTQSLPPAIPLTINDSLGGVVLAHELGHNYDRKHVNCPVGVPENLDTQYPYPVCQIDSDLPERHIGFDPISQQLITPNSVSDLMSYSVPFWISDYTWNGLLNEIGSFSSNTISYATSVSLGDRLVTISHNNDTGEVEFSYSYEVTDELYEKAKSLENSLNIDPNYEMWVYGNSNQLLYKLPVMSSKSYEDGSESTLYISFLPSNFDVNQLDLVHISETPSQVLSTLTGGGQAPTVSIQSPNVSTVAQDKLHIQWQGNDPDNNPLRYTVRYSADNGANWQTLVTETPDTEFVVGTKGLPGSNGEGRVQVIASEGLLDDRAISEPFTLVKQPPEGWISIETPKVRVQTDLAIIYHNETVIFHGYGYDDEDGPLDDNAFSWSIEGVVDRTGMGKDYWVSNLPPGFYDVTLKLTDSDNNQVTDSVTLWILPKLVSDAPLPTLDGKCEEAAYKYDMHPIVLDYATQETAYVRMIHADLALYACFSGLPIGADSPGDWAGLYVDVKNDGGNLPQNDDLGFFIGRDGIPFSMRGDGTTLKMDLLPQGMDAAMFQGDVSWSAEIRIEESKLGGWGHDVRAFVSHFWLQTTGDDTHWPDIAVWNNPSSWGQLYLGDDMPRTVYLPLILK